jgi:hypothetical protein
MPELKLVKIVLDADCDCDGCQCPLMPGEVAWTHEETWSTGCCQPCCRDAARQKSALFFVESEAAHA